MKERWIELAKKEDFDAMAKSLGVTPLTARLMVNRDIRTVEEGKKYLYGTMEDLSSPYAMKDMEKAIALLLEAKEAGGKVAIVSDFDDDGIFAGEILFEGLTACGIRARLYTPNRTHEGYGMNARIVDEAHRDGCTLILTCDNGIAAFDAAQHAKALGLKLIVTDHHEVQYEETESGKKLLLPEADAILDPKQPDCAYPCKLLCGAGVAFRLIQALYAHLQIPKEKEEELYEYLAIATIADVMELKDENRIFVREGLKKLQETKKTGLQELIRACGLEEGRIDVYTVGFVIGPCFNAVGRLADVELAFRLLQTEDRTEAAGIAEKIRNLNLTRQELTEKGLKEAEALMASGAYDEDQVLLLRVHDVPESVVGIVAGKIKEHYYRPTFVFTDAEDGLKGSGRSVEAYHMMEALQKEKDLLQRFGGHKMAAGLTVLEKDLEELRKRLNAHAGLTEKDLTPVVYIDARLPLSQVSEALIAETEALQPFGTGNRRPLYARPHFKVHSLRLIGKNRNVLRMSLSDGSGVTLDAVMFEHVEEVLSLIREEYGEEALRRAEAGAANAIDLAFTFTPGINEYRGVRKLQITCHSACRIHEKSL